MRSNTSRKSVGKSRRLESTSVRRQRTLRRLGLAMAAFTLGTATTAYAAADGLIHRYDFNDGTANDTVGTMHGSALSGVTFNAGVAIFDGGADSYIDLLGNDVADTAAVSGAYTIEFWGTIQPNGYWNRLYDFGGNPGYENNYIFTSAANYPGWDWNSRMVIKDGGEQVAWFGAENPASLGNANPANPPLGSGQPVHMAFVYDQTGNMMYVRRDDAYGSRQQSSAPMNDALLTNIPASTGYIGASNYGPGDGFLKGEINEFRIWSKALTQTEFDFNGLWGADGLASYNLNDAAAGDWNDPPTWTGTTVPPGGLPEAGTAVTISGFPVTLGGGGALGSSGTAMSVKITSPGSLTLVGGTLTIAADPVIALDTTAGTLVMDAASVLNVQKVDTTTSLRNLSAAPGATINVAKQLLANSNFDISGLNVVLDPAANLTLVSGTLTKTEGMTLPNLLTQGGAVAMGGTGLTVTTALNVQSGNFDTAGALSFTATGAAVAINGGTLTLGHDLTAASLTLNSGSIVLNGKNLTVADLTANINLDMGASALAASNSITLNNSVLTLSNAVSTPTLTLNNSSLAGAGSVSGVSQYYFANIASTNPTASAIWGGTGATMNIGTVIGDQLQRTNSNQLVVLSAANTYDGPTVLRSGALEAADGHGLPAASNLQLFGGVLQTSGTFSRALGTDPGQVQWTGDGGFAAKGGKLTVALDGAPTPLVWSSTPNFVGDGQWLNLGSTTADSEVEFQHDIDLNSSAINWWEMRAINVAQNPAASTSFATLSGAISGNSGFRKTGDGLLRLTAANSYTGTTLIDGGVLEADAGAGLPTDSNLVLRNWASPAYGWFGGGVLQTQGTFERNLTSDYNTTGSVVWENGGFAAKGGNLTVTLNGGAPIDWGVDMDGAPKVFGSTTADREVVLTNDMTFSGWRDLVVNDNPAVTTDFATLSGAVTNVDGRLNKFGQGKVVMSSPSNRLNELNVQAGELAFGDTGMLTVNNMWMNDGGKTSTMTIDAGNEVTVNNALYVSGGYDPDQVSVINMTDGTLNVGLAGGTEPYDSTLMLGGNAGTGVMNQSGGTVTVGVNGVDLGWWDDGAFAQKTIGIYNLNGGVLSTSNVHQGSPYGVGKGYFNFNGGVLQASQDNMTFMEGLTAATVLEAGAVIDTNGYTITIAQKLEHGGAAATDGGLTKIGDGTLTLTANSTFTGDLRVNQGALATGPSTALASSLAVNGAIISPGGDGVAGTLSVKNLTSNDLSTFNFDLSDNVSTGNDRINVDGDLTFTGTTTIAVNQLAGSLAVSGAYTLFSYTGDLTGDATNLSLTGIPADVPAVVPDARPASYKLRLSVPNEVQLAVVGPYDLTWVGGKSGNTWDLKNTQNWSNTIKPSDKTFWQLDSVLFDDSGSNSPNINIDGTLIPGRVTVDNNTKDYTFAGSGSIAGDYPSLLKKGSGKLTISNPGNNFKQGVRVEGGTLLLAGDNDTLGLDVPVTMIGGVLDLGGTSPTFSGNNKLSVQGGEIKNGTMNVSDQIDGQAGLISADIAGSALLNKTSAGTLTLKGASTVGNVQVRHGTLAMSGNGSVDFSTGAFHVGEATGDNGKLTMTDNASIVGINRFIVGATGTAIGEVEMSGHSNITIHAGQTSNGVRDYTYTTGFFLIGSGGTAGSTAKMTMTDYASVTGEMAWFDVGENATSGTLIMKGHSSINITDPDPDKYMNVVNFAQYSGRIVIAHGNSKGYLRIQDDANITARTIWFQENNGGGAGRGVVDQLGGTVTMTGYAMDMGRDQGGIYNISGGVLRTDPFTLDSTTYPWSGITMGRGGTGGGIMNISGTGLVDVSKSGDRAFWFGRDGAKGTVNLDGGMLITPELRLDSAIAGNTVNFNGGVLKASAGDNGVVAGRPFFSPYLSLNVKAGGAKIDTNGYDIAIAQNLADGGGGLTKMGSGALTLNAANTYSGGTDVQAGTLRTTNSAGLGAATGSTRVAVAAVLLADGGMTQSKLTNHGTTSITGAGIVPTVDGTGSLTIATAASSLAANSIAQGSLSINDGVVTIAPLVDHPDISASVVLGQYNGVDPAVRGLLSIAGTGKLDLADNDLILHSDPLNRQDDYQQVFNAIKSGLAGGAWTGGGLTSSAAKNQDPAKRYAGLASMINDKGGGEGAWYLKFDGVDVTVNDILAKYSWNGDANLDGVVNADDYFRIDAGFITQAGGYQNGDFNYDRVVNADDYFLIDSAFLGQAGPLSAASHAMPVPEPSGMAAVAMGIMCLAVRRKRRNGSAA